MTSAEGVEIFPLNVILSIFFSMTVPFGCSIGSVVLRLQHLVKTEQFVLGWER